MLAGMILPILRYPDKRLKSECARVTHFGTELRELADSLIETMQKHDGVGIAAPQVGHLIRVIAVTNGKTKAATVMVNPVLAILSGGMAAGEEGCLSIPGKSFKVNRWRKCRVTWQDVNGTPMKGDFAGLAARIIQHELDHTRGVLILDRAEKR